MRIAILGWGSLLWEEHPDFDRHHGHWQDDGPTLKLEFSRFSTTRLSALTLVIDEEHGTPTTVAWSLSKRATPEDAVCDLRSREGTTLENIGSTSVSEAPSATNANPANHAIGRWARTKTLDAVIWTALKSNFLKGTNQRFSVEAAVTHLKALGPAAKVKAAEYVWRAPDFVRTPLRSVLESEPWFKQSS